MSTLLGDRRSWLVPSLVSLALVVGLLAVAGPMGLRGVLAEARPASVAAAALALVATNLFHAVRLGVLVRGRLLVPFRDRLVLTLRYGLYVAVLPARLGEVAYVLRLRHDLGLRGSAALALTVQQRLLDVVLVGLLAVVAGLGLAGGALGGPLLAVGGALAVGTALMLVIRLPDVLTCAVRSTLGRAEELRGRWRGLVLGLLRARRWAGHVVGSGALAQLLLLTAGEWAANVLAIGLLIGAFGVLPVPAELFAVAVLVVVAGALPLQTVGGIGVLEFALAGSLVVAGSSLTQAAAITIAMRTLLLAVPVILWLPTLAVRPDRAGDADRAGAPS